MSSEWLRSRNPCNHDVVAEHVPDQFEGHEPRRADQPEGEPYEWFRRAETLLAQGNADAAAVLLERLRALDPDSTSVLEDWSRALFDARRFEEAVLAFAELVERSPDDDYAHYGLGMSLWRLQKFPAARDHLAMARVMRPGRSEYESALTQVHATLKARVEAGLPAEGPVHT